MEIVKKNIVSIVCGVIAVLALVAVFVYPLPGYYEDLHKRAAERAAKAQKINSLMNKQRSLPVVDLENPEAEKLPVSFPSKLYLKAADDLRKGLSRESRDTYLAAWDLNVCQYAQRGKPTPRNPFGTPPPSAALLVPGSLPGPANVSEQRTYDPIAVRYRKDISDAMDRLRNQELVAGIPPTADEISRRAKEIAKSLEGKLIRVGQKIHNLDVVQAEYQARVAKLPEEMRAEMAKKFKMYVDPNQVLRIPARIPAEPKVPSPADVWWAQVEYWVSRDVVAAIKETNAKSSNVTESAIKNLIALNIPSSFFPATTAGSGGAAVAGGGGGFGANRFGAEGGGEAGTHTEGGPTGALPDATVAVTEAPAQSPTKRISNNLFDVVQFTLTLDIEADQVTTFLHNLSTNRFLTVTRMEMQPVDLQFMENQGYVYGKKAVVTLRLECESLFLREWTIYLMPKAIRDELGIPAPPRGGGLPTASAGRN